MRQRLSLRSEVLVAGLVALGWVTVPACGGGSSNSDGGAGAGGHAAAGGHGGAAAGAGGHAGATGGAGGEAGAGADGGLTGAGGSLDAGAAGAGGVAGGFAGSGGKAGAAGGAGGKAGAGGHGGGGASGTGGAGGKAGAAGGAGGKAGAAGGAGGKAGAAGGAGGKAGAGGGGSGTGGAAGGSPDAGPCTASFGAGNKILYTFDTATTNGGTLDGWVGDTPDAGANAITWSASTGHTCPGSLQVTVPGVAGASEDFIAQFVTGANWTGFAKLHLWAKVASTRYPVGSSLFLYVQANGFTDEISDYVPLPGSVFTDGAFHEMVLDLTTFPSAQDLRDIDKIALTVSLSDVVGVTPAPLTGWIDDVWLEAAP